MPSAAILAHVPQALLEKAEDVLIVERVIDAAPFAAPAHDPLGAHQPELVRDRRLADADTLRYVADAELGFGDQRVNDAKPGRIAEHAEGFGEGFDGLGVSENRWSGG